MNSLSHPKDVLRLAEKYHYEKQHAYQVTKLALNLFDELYNLNFCSVEDKKLLEYAALLHDIGWINGQKGHHKTTMQLILNDTSLSLSSEQRLIVALISRYHRKTLPHTKHPYLDNLPEDTLKKIWVIGGILRIADGLDRTHFNVVETIQCFVDDNTLKIHCVVKDNAEFELAAAKKKSDMLSEILKCKIQITSEIL